MSCHVEEISRTPNDYQGSHAEGRGLERRSDTLARQKKESRVLDESDNGSKKITTATPYLLIVDMINPFTFPNAVRIFQPAWLSRHASRPSSAEHTLREFQLFM
jgi:hypothetical protein